LQDATKLEDSASATRDGSRFSFAWKSAVSGQRSAVSGQRSAVSQDYIHSNYEQAL